MTEQTPLEVNELTVIEELEQIVAPSSESSFLE
jgi:hypothetical protein